MRHVADKLNLSLELLSEQICWPLYKTHGHAFDGFKKSITDFDSVFGEIECDPIVRKEVEACIRKRMTPQSVKVRSDLEVNCFGYEGIDAIKAALIAGEQCSTPEIIIKVRFIY